MGRKPNKKIIVEEYCFDNPDMKDYTLAVKIHKENKRLFKSVENCRNCVRLVRGHIGQKDRHLATAPKPLNYDTTNQIETVSYSKILILDIETAPLLANIWGIWNQNINLESIHSDWFMLTWAAKWLFEDKVYSAKVTPKEAINNDDKRIVQSLINLLSEADIVVTHNGDRFDLPRINTRAIVNRIPPPLPYISIDTLKVAKRSFAFTSNKLDYINKMLGLPQKQNTDMSLWRDCFHGKKEGLKRMLEYNINDVRIHEQTYLTMRPYIKSHPNIGLFIVEGGSACPSCGCKELSMSGKYYNTMTNSYELFRCKNCSSIGRIRKGLKKNLDSTSIAR